MLDGQFLDLTGILAVEKENVSLIKKDNLKPSILCFDV